MLRHRLIPNIILNNGFVVQSVQFQHTNIIGNAITAVDFLNNWAADEIIIIDATRHQLARKKIHTIIEELSERCFVPLTVGGWIQNMDEINQFLREGADKVTINSEAVKNPSFIKNASKQFGSQCITIGIDVKKNSKNEYEVMIERGTKSTKMDPIDWAKQIQDYGAGEILLTSIDNDGMQQGYDLELLKTVCDSVSIPVIAFGGVGNWNHLVEGIKIGKADAVSAGNIFHFSEHSVFKAKEYMIKEGVNVRVPMFHNISTKRKPKYDRKGIDIT